ncbi:MAG TPA: 16S rRNA (uracil(1498)-N(3))-methyltransferase [Oleiagrimonas sp.]|nr:16S rRNA (uracil(1498)-N(3))-methyltransferase [Oleiagrimonas sp.]
MRQIRLYVDVPLAGVDQLVLPAAAARHATRVLRLAPGHPLTLFNGDGNDYACTLDDIAGKSVSVHLLGHHAVARETPWPLTLAQCLARGDKMDLVVQKATELGVACIAPLVSERSGVRLDAARADKRLRHWQAVAAAACEQCGRAHLPRIDMPQALEAWLDGLHGDSGLRLALLPGSTRRVRELSMPADGATLVVGPEGGLGERDTTLLANHGFDGLSLGPRILRTETAGMAALAAILACHGDA